MLDKKKENYIPEIVYYDDATIPTINIPKGKDAPSRLIIYMAYQTDETEPGPEGVGDIPVVDLELNQYFSYNHAKELLDPELLDKLRVAFGLEELGRARKKGEKVLNKVQDNVAKNKGN